MLNNFLICLNLLRNKQYQTVHLILGSITCAAYPLSQIDTIDNDTGNISKNSALNLVVFGVSITNYHFFNILTYIMILNKIYYVTCIIDLWLQNRKY